MVSDEGEGVASEVVMVVVEGGSGSELGLVRDEALEVRLGIEGAIVVSL